MMYTGSYSLISLEEMDEVRLMNRIDRKFCFHKNDLQDILDSVRDDYYMLQVNGEELISYSTVYFDTVNNEMYNAHHNGKLNRYKIRKRQYDNTGDGFLEVKFKTNKGRTIKNRIPTGFLNDCFADCEQNFINSFTPYSPDELTVSLRNNFKRITLVNKNFKERITIDIGITFQTAEKVFSLDELVVAEVKSDRKSEQSAFLKSLLDHRHKASGFSKYAIGRSIGDNGLKRNAFKEKIRRLEKILKSNMNLF